MRFISKIKEDRGDAIAVLGMMLIVVIMVVGGGVLDFTKGYQLKRGYTNAAQHATHSAIMHQYPKSGALKVDAAAQAIVSYENLAHEGVVNRNNILATCDWKQPRMMKVVYAENRKAAKAYKYGMKEYEYPKGVITVVKEFDLNRVNLAPGNYEAEVRRIKGLIAGQVPKEVKNGKYHAIIIEVTESTPNTMLAGGTVASGNKEAGNRMKCQKIGVAASATTYTENE